MKRLILAAGLLAALWSPQMQAQTVDMRAKVPFDFQVGKDRMPAGEYVFSHVQGGLLRISPMQGTSSVMALTENFGGPTGSGDAGLEFRNYSGVYFLKTFWTDSGVKRALRTSPYEREIAARLKRGDQVQTARVAVTSK